MADESNKKKRPEPGDVTSADSKLVDGLESDPKFFKDKLEPVGLFKKPYPYYDGVKPS